MGQAIGETVFDVLYLSFAMVLGISLLCKGTTKLIKMVGWMSALLGFGDAFHLIPRCYALWTDGLAANAAALGIGKLITSITMTVFYLLLYYIWKERYAVTGKKAMDATMWILAAARILLCALPQNDWLSPTPPLFYGILRNIPFTVMGILIIVWFAQKAWHGKDRALRFIPLAVILSFGFYLPVVLFSGVLPIIGMLMIPKTLAYVWIMVMGWKLQKQAA